MRQLLLLQQPYQKLQKHVKLILQRKISHQFQIYCKLFHRHQSSSIHCVFNAFSCSYNRTAQEDKSKPTGQIFCNSFSIYHSCAKTFGSTVLCRGQTQLNKLNSHPIIYIDLNALTLRKGSERP